MIKPQLETIQLSEATASFKFFKHEVTAFNSYWHYHKELELTLIDKGYGMRMVGDSIESFSDVDLVLIGENLPHNYVTTDIQHSRKNIAYVFQFSKQLFDAFTECQILQELFVKARNGIKFTAPKDSLLWQIRTFSELSPLKQLIRLLELLGSLSDDENRVLLSSIAYSRHTISSKFQSRISKVTNYLLDHMSENISLQRIAQYAKMSPPAFSRWFKHSTGQNFITYLNTIRVEKACQFLLHTDWLVSEIAYQTGFESISNFNRTFQKYKRESPMSYRKRNSIGM